MKLNNSLANTERNQGSGHGVTGVGELHCGPWKLNRGSLEKQLMHSIRDALPNSVVLDAM